MRQLRHCWWVLLLWGAGMMEQPAACKGESWDERFAAVADQPRYAGAHWGVLAVDLATGETLCQHNESQLFAPASVTKLFSVAAALDRLGADYTFRTPVYAVGQMDEAGTLNGNLVLVASGDLTLGGRTRADGTLSFKSSDHTYAIFSQTAELTEEDPLAGLNELARQIAAAGIRHVHGDVVIDARLFDECTSSGSGPERVTPIYVNDNLIDLAVRPGEAGQPATVAVRPASACFQVDAQVMTVPAGGATALTVESPGPRRITLRGTIAAGERERVTMCEVPDPSSFARALLIEALERAGVRVEASALADNDAARLPARESYPQLQRVAELVSPPLSENAKLILKVSHNLHASTLPLLLAVSHGERTVEAGLKREGEQLAALGVPVEVISFGGGAGGERADYITPQAAVALLRGVSQRPYFATYRDALPFLGIDGTLVTAVGDGSPARGKFQAKTGTLLWENRLRGGFLLSSKALAGYGTTSSGREVAFCFCVNHVLLSEATQTAEIGRDLGRLCEALYASW